MLRYSAYASIALLAACALLGARGARAVPSPSCQVITDGGGCYDMTSVSTSGNHYASQVSPATVQADVNSGGFTVDDAGATSGGCKVNPADRQCHPLVCYQTGSQPLWTRWGFWPTAQVVYEDRDWCGYLNWYQTSRFSRLRVGFSGSGSFCTDSTPKYNYRVSGGNGNFSTDVHTGSHFACSAGFGTPAWNWQDFQVWRCNMGGWCQFITAGHE